MSGIEGGMEYWKCKKCNEPFTSVGAARIHVDSMHSGRDFDELIERVV